MGQEDVRRDRDQFCCVFANLGGVGRGPPSVDAHVAADGPTQLPQRLQERPDAGLIFRIVRGCGQEYADAPHPLALLRTRRERARGRAAEQRDELAPLHSITSSARPSSGSGNVIPNVFAVLRLMINSTFVACWTGMSAGFSPFRIRPV